MKASRREAISGAFFVAPWAIGFCVFMLYPLIASIYYSFCDYSVLKPPVWIGAANYVDLFHDDVFRQTIWNTAVYAVGALPLTMVVGIALALLLNAKIKGLAVYRTIFYLPSLVPQVALAVLWLWIFNGQHGILNAVLQMAHLPHPDWLGDAKWSKPAIILLSVWGVGNSMVIYLAGLQDVPQQLYEAADLDGAGWWARTWHVTLPTISPVILFNLIMGIIGTLQVFAVPYVISPEGSPVRSIYFYTTYLFTNAFIYHKMGLACAMGWIMFIVILVLTMLALRLSERHVHYGSS